MEHTVGGRKSVKALGVALRDAVVKRAVCALGGFNEVSFLIAIDLAFDGALLKNDELKSQLLNSYHHVGPHGGTKDRQPQGLSKGMSKSKSLFLDCF